MASSNGSARSITEADLSCAYVAVVLTWFGTPYERPLPRFSRLTHMVQL
jgi:hypothetical protein